MKRPGILCREQVLTWEQISDGSVTLRKSRGVEKLQMNQVLLKKLDLRVLLMANDSVALP